LPVICCAVDAVEVEDRDREDRAAAFGDLPVRVRRAAEVVLEETISEPERGVHEAASTLFPPLVTSISEPSTVWAVIGRAADPGVAQTVVQIAAIQRIADRVEFAGVS
jgi:hypothetical protein